MEIVSLKKKNSNFKYHKSQSIDLSLDWNSFIVLGRRILVGMLLLVLAY